MDTKAKKWKKDKYTLTGKAKSVKVSFKLYANVSKIWNIKWNSCISFVLVVSSILKKKKIQMGLSYKSSFRRYHLSIKRSCWKNIKVYKRWKELLIFLFSRGSRMTGIENTAYTSDMSLLQRKGEINLWSRVPFHLHNWF